jgi:hypothetical protein
MQPDLVGLEINKGEIKGLTGVRIQQLYRPPVLKTFIQEGVKTLIVSALVLLSYMTLAFIFPNDRQWLGMIHSLLVGGLVIEDGYKIILSIKYRNLIRILEDVDRYHAIIKAIALHDQLEAIGNPQIQLHHRDQVMAALQLIREDLVRAMKTERILRKNRKFVADHHHLFVTNLNALIGLQISDRSTEHGRLLNEALQIASHIQAELKQFQDRQSSN